MWQGVYICDTCDITVGGVTSLAGATIEGYELLGCYSFMCRHSEDNQNNLKSEIHIIAYFYHWSRQDILNLTSHDRRHYIELIREQVKAESANDDDEDYD